MKRRASLFFTTDTILAVIVIVTVFLTIQGTTTTTAQLGDPQGSATELNGFLSETTVEDTLSEYPGVYYPDNYDAQTDTWRAELSLSQEIARLVHEGDDATASSLARNASGIVMDSQYAYQVSVDNTLLVNQSSIDKAEAYNYVVKRTLLYTVTDDGRTIVGPKEATIKVWI